jgi:dihydroorotase
MPVETPLIGSTLVESTLVESTLVESTLLAPGEAQVPCFGGGSRAIDLSRYGALSAAERARLLLVPSFVDLCCDPGFPGFPVRETPATLTAAASAGGFGELVLSPRVDPVVDTPEHLARAERGSGHVRTWPTGALTLGLRGEELAEVGLLVRAGAVAVSDGAVPMRDSVVLKNALEYAREFGVVVLLRPADADLDAVGVVHDSPLATQLGLRGNSVASEIIGVARAIALARVTGARVHLSHIGSAQAIEQVATAQREGLPVSASTPCRNLLLDEHALDDGSYDARFRLHPPLRGAGDRAALVDGVRAGVLLLAADHAPRAPEEKDHEFERAVPGSVGLASAFSAALTALGDVGVVVRALSTGPRACLGLPGGAWALLDPGAEWTVPHAGAGPARCDALAGRRLRGRVLGLVGGVGIG